MYLPLLPLSASLLMLSCAPKHQHLPSFPTADVTPAQQLPGIQTDTLTLYDSSRQRAVPVALYFRAMPGDSVVKGKKLILLNHGYGSHMQEYATLAHQLAEAGYVVASIQHELPGDAPIPSSGIPQVVRRPNWERGVQNMLFVLEEFKTHGPLQHWDELILIGHSNGGDMVMLFAHLYPERVSKVVSLDNRRMPLPRVEKPRILSLRSSDQPADEGVLPSPAEQERYGIRVIPVEVRHDDMSDYSGSAKQKQEMHRFILDFLAS
jgi:predicted dienelactone hydrolase